MIEEGSGPYVYGFAPEFHEDSRLLILGSFPSVKSRQIEFYYGNKQNRFWNTICSFFGEEVPKDVEGKKDFLRRNKIALWDVVASCKIVGSQDATISDVTLADIPELLDKAPIEAIFCNGSLSYKLLQQNFGGIEISIELMPSTSPANPRFCKEFWYDKLRTIFK